MWMELSEISFNPLGELTIISSAAFITIIFGSFFHDYA